MSEKWFVAVLFALAAAVGTTAAAPPDEVLLKQRYDTFVESLDHRTLAKDYPAAVRNLDSPDPKKQIVGIKTLAATEEPKAIPWIVPFLDSEDRGVRIYAGQALNALVATHQLKRWDKLQSDKVVILSPGPGDIDLKPASWVIFKMLRMPNDGNTHAFAANMIGYGGFEEYEHELQGLLKSRHPAVTTAARRALEMIGASPDVGDSGQSANVYETALGDICVDLIPDKREVMVGEPVSLSLVVRNRSDTDLQTIQGGDYRNRLGRPDSHTVTAVGPSGHVVPLDDARMGELIETLGAKMPSADSDISDEAVRYLTAIEDERAIPFFNEAASSSNYGLRFAAMNALARFRSDDALHGIKKGMTSQAADMMSNATTEEVAGQLADNIRHSAAAALSSSPHPKARDLLLSMWKDPYYGVRIDVLHALGKMDTPESLQMLQRMADDPNEVVRNEALRYIDLRSKRQKKVEDHSG